MVEKQKKQVLFQVGHDCRTFAVVAHEANAHDNVGADGVIDKMKGCFPPIEKDAGGRRIQRTEIGRYRTPKARCGVYRCSPSGRVSEGILRAATPMYCGALFLLVGKLSKNCHWSRVLFRYEAMVQLAFCRLMYNKLCDWNLNSFLLRHALSVLSFALKLYAL